MKKLSLIITFAVVLLAVAYGQTQNEPPINPERNSGQSRKYSVSTTYLSLDNFGEEKTNTQHYELHLGYKLSPKSKIGIKLATWKMFAPMGMPMQEQLKFDEANFYPGRLRETGIGISYQRLIWRGLFVSAEILPQLKTYLDESNKKLANGFKLYTSYHIGYHITFWKNRIFLEPQIHCQYWPVDTNVPQSFRAKDDEWNNYFLFEPNLYIGANLAY